MALGESCPTTSGFMDVLGRCVMLRIGIDESRPYCDGRSRRSFLQLGMAGMGALSLGTLARAREASAANALASASAGGASASGVTPA